jgi:hypothetical protein
MKKLLLITLLVLFCVSSVLPPALPSSFYGYVYSDRGLNGKQVFVYIDNVQVAKTRIFLYQGQTVYVIDVPMDDVLDGATATFKIGRVICGTGVLHSGTAQQLDLIFSRK